MSKQRSRRLRKKLHVGEFQEFGLAFKVRLKPGTLDIRFVDALLNEVIDPRGLEFGGWAAGGFVSRLTRGSVSDADRSTLVQWLGQRPDVEEVRMSGLVDAWYTTFVPDDLLEKVVG